jgi:hypothetical protein
MFLKVFQGHYTLFNESCQLVPKITKCAYLLLATIPRRCIGSSTLLSTKDRFCGSPLIVRGSQLIGIITETGILRATAGALGGETQCLREIVCVPDVKGNLSDSRQVARWSGDVRSLVIWVGKESKQDEIKMKVLRVKRGDVMNVWEKIAFRSWACKVGIQYEPRLISSH